MGSYDCMNTIRAPVAVGANKEANLRTSFGAKQGSLESTARYSQVYPGTAIVISAVLHAFLIPFLLP